MATGVRTTYTDTTPQKRSIRDMIDLLEWSDAALLNRFGVSNQGKFRLDAWPRTKYEWLEDTLSPRETTMNDSGGISDTDTSMVVTEGSYFKEGDVLLIESELVYVSAVSTNTLTIVRGFGGTTAAAHADALTVKLATIARLEGADYDTGHTTTVSNPYNHTQILSEAIKITGSETVDQKYGINDSMAYHLAKLIGGGQGLGGRFRAGKLPILLQQTFYHGKRAAGTATTSRAMGGFEQFVTTHVTDKASAALEREDIESLFTDIYLDGGMPNILICNSHVRRKISSFYEGLIRTDRTEAQGGSVISTIVTDFGNIDVIFDRWCPTDRVYLVQADYLGWIEYRPFQVIDRPASGDYVIKEVLGEYGFVLTNEKAHGYLKNVSTTL